MLDPPPQGTASSRCYLLELPGELRNHIYNCVLAHYDYTNDKRRYIRIIRPPWPPWFNRRCPGSEECVWPELPRGSLGLTQTCRVIRREFRPLHFSHYAVYFWHGFDQFPAYISRYFPQVGDACGTYFLQAGSDEGNCMEILPLIQLLIKASNLTLEYETSPRDQVNFAALIDVKGNKRWREYVEKNVTGIVYFTNYRNICKPRKNQLFVNIRHTVGEPWMIEEKKQNMSDLGALIRSRTPANKPGFVKKWLEFVGIAHLDKTLDDVGIQVAAANEGSDSGTSATEDA